MDSGSKTLHFAYPRAELGNVERERRFWGMTLKGIDISWGWCGQGKGQQWVSPGASTSASWEG